MRGYGAIVLAGGKGRRMGTDIPKQFLPLGRETVLWHSLHAFEESVAEEVVLVVPPDETEFCREQYGACRGFRKVTRVVEGGKERYDSVYAGLKALASRGFRYVAIHDGARPLVTPELIARSFEEAEQYGACVAAVPVKDSLKFGDREGFAGAVIPRDQVWAIQTPQTFEYALCFSAYRRMLEGAESCEGITDDAMVVERYTGHRVKLCRGDYRNLKITTPEDLTAAEAYLRLQNR